MDGYAEAMRRMRKEKDEFFRRSPHSPIAPEERAAFQGLRYFDPDPAFRVRATWIPSASPKPVRVQTSDGQVRDYVDAGRFAFEIGGQALSLTGYGARGGHSLFVPFRDATSGKETYGAGRYLDLELPHAGETIVDLNLAYNPYCAYNEAYSCPLPPPENWLKAEIRAGERVYGH